MSIDASEIRLDTFRGGVGCDVLVKITHIPTGISAQSKNKSENKARKEAMAALEKELV